MGQKGLLNHLRVLELLFHFIIAPLQFFILHLQGFFRFLFFGNIFFYRDIMCNLAVRIFHR